MYRHDELGDDELRSALERAAGSPTLSARDELLESLMARIEDGGADVADAPAPLPMLSPVPGTGRGARIATKAAGIGVAGWIAIAVGTAAAATGAALLLSPTTEAPPTLPPSTTPSASATPDAIDDTPRPTFPEVTGLPVTPTVPHLDGLVPDISDPGTLLPEGPLRDAVAPVISAVNTGGLTSGALNLLTCEGTAPVVASASDNVGVTAATLRLTAAGDYSVTVPMTSVGAGQWSATVGPLALAATASLTGSATVTVEVRDAEGNTATSTAQVPLTAIACLG